MNNKFNKNLTKDIRITMQLHPYVVISFLGIHLLKVKKKYMSNSFGRAHRQKDAEVGLTMLDIKYLSMSGGLFLTWCRVLVWCWCAVLGRKVIP